MTGIPLDDVHELLNTLQRMVDALERCADALEHSSRAQQDQIAALHAIETSIDYSA
jgi:hypothetical protein